MPPFLPAWPPCLCSGELSLVDWGVSNATLEEGTSCGRVAECGHPSWQGPMNACMPRHLAHLPPLTLSKTAAAAYYKRARLAPPRVCSVCEDNARRGGAPYCVCMTAECGEAPEAAQRTAAAVTWPLAAAAHPASATLCFPSDTMCYYPSSHLFFEERLTTQRAK